MRRAPIVAAATVAGMAGVLSFHTHKTAVSLPTGASTSGSPAPGTSRTPARTEPTTAPAPKANAGPPAATAVRTATGIAEQFGYGVLAVKVTVKGATISDVAVTDLQVADPTSAQIAQQVVPMLRSEVLSAQSARINGISGATYTSEAYAYSLQSALDKLHVR